MLPSHAFIAGVLSGPPGQFWSRNEYLFAWSPLSINISKRISIVKITLNDSKLMSTNIIWFGASNFKIALIASSWSHPFTTTRCVPVHNKSKCCPISSPTCLCECLFTAIIIYAKTTHFNALTSKWMLLEKTHQYEYLDCYRKCWNKEFNLNPSNNSNFWEIGVFYFLADYGFTSIYIRAG